MWRLCLANESFYVNFDNVSLLELDYLFVVLCCIKLPDIVNLSLVFCVQVVSEPSYSLTITLMLPQPHLTVAHWRPQEAVNCECYSRWWAACRLFNCKSFHIIKVI